MTSFEWQVTEKNPQKLRTVIMAHGVTRTLLKQIKFHGGQIKVNGAEQLTNYMVTKGDVVTVTLPPEPGNDHVPTSNVTLDIVYEDSNWLIVNKPAGVASVPAHIYANDSLVNRVKGYYERQRYENQRVHIVTRLDRDTSGLVIFAKHHMAHSVLDKQLKEHTLRKEYLAIVVGNFKHEHVEVNLPIGRDPESFVKRRVAVDGKMAMTEFWVQQHWPQMELIRIQLHTGRTHQIRVHMTALGHPLLGDWLYNPTNHQMKRQALHCFQVRFYDPFSNKIISCQAPLPADMKLAIKRANQVDVTKV